MSNLICAKCKKEIKPLFAYVVVRAEIVLREPAQRPVVFTCIEQSENYAQKLIMHDVCWIELLREFGIKLHDMNEVYKKYKERIDKDGLG
jgi:hypothetical protein